MAQGGEEDHAIADEVEEFWGKIWRVSGGFVDDLKVYAEGKKELDVTIRVVEGVSRALWASGNVFRLGILCKKPSAKRQGV